MLKRKKGCCKSMKNVPADTEKDIKKKRIMHEKLPAVMTVEASLLMAIILFTLAAMIVFAYRKRDEVTAAFVVQEAAVDAAYTEEVWEVPRNGVEQAEKNAGIQLRAVPRLQNSSVRLSRGLNTADAEYSGAAGNGLLHCRINDVENFMRLSTVVLDWKEALCGETN